MITGLAIPRKPSWIYPFSIVVLGYIARFNLFYNVSLNQRLLDPDAISILQVMYISSISPLNKGKICSYNSFKSSNFIKLGVVVNRGWPWLRSQLDLHFFKPTIVLFLPWPDAITVFVVLFYILMFLFFLQKATVTERFSVSTTASNHWILSTCVDRSQSDFCNIFCIQETNTQLFVC